MFTTFLVKQIETGEEEDEKSEISVVMRGNLRDAHSHEHMYIRMNTYSHRKLCLKVRLFVHVLLAC